MKRYQNINCCQINIKAGQSEYYLPKNTNWEGKRIEKIVAYLPDPSVPMQSPIDGATVLNANDAASLYFDLFSEDGVNVMHNVHAYSLSDENNYPVELHQKLNYELSRVYFTTAPVADGALLLYMFYGETEAYPEDPHENITVNFSVDAWHRITFTEIIERYMYARAKGVRAITVWSGRYPDYYEMGYITLRDIDGKLAHDYIPTKFFRPQYEGAGGTPNFLANKIPLDVVELDFNNCELFNGSSTSTDYTVTFYY